MRFAQQLEAEITRSSILRLLPTYITILAVLTILVGCGASDPDDSSSGESNNHNSEAQEDGETCQNLPQTTPVDELDSCERDEGCEVYSNGWLDADKIAESDESCSELHRDSDKSLTKGLVDLCLRSEWIEGESPAPTMAGYYHENDDEWRVYILSNIPAGPSDKLKFVSCEDIPKEAENAREACLKCTGREGIIGSI